MQFLLFRTLFVGVESLITNVGFLFFEINLMGQIRTYFKLVGFNCREHSKERRIRRRPMGFTQHVIRRSDPT